ncbi:MAG: replicative DNA helicase, partial [Rhodospirillales bacterium]|nr:replicative DNA helicase [Rhodospirillales bacterium]
YYLSRAEPKQRADEADDKYHDRYLKWQDRLDKVHNMAEVIIAKQRHGPTGTVNLHFNGEFTRFGDYIADDRLPDHH